MTIVLNSQSVIRLFLSHHDFIGEEPSEFGVAAALHSHVALSSGCHAMPECGSPHDRGRAAAGLANTPE